MSQAERDRIMKLRGQTVQNPNIDKRNISNVDTAEEGEVEETPPNDGTQFGKQARQQKKKKKA